MRLLTQLSEANQSLDLGPGADPILSEPRRPMPTIQSGVREETVAFRVRAQSDLGGSPRLPQALNEGGRENDEQR